MPKMGNYVVRYSNEMNTIELGKLSVREANLFASICAYVKNKGTHKVSMTFNQIREMSGYSDRNNKRLHAELLALNRKLVHLYYEFEDDRGLTGFNLFQWWRLGNDETFEIAVSEMFEFMLNNLGAKFTRFELDEYCGIDGKYSKSLYRLLKQFRRTGLYCVHLEDFYNLLNVTKSYKQISKLDKFVIKPAIAELGIYFENLSYKKTYKSGRGHGGKIVTGFEFTFKADYDSDADTMENTINELKRLIAETELKILSTQKAMDKQSDLGNFKQYEVHKKKNIYFREKLEKLKNNLAHFDPEQLSLEIPEIDSPTEDEKATAQKNVNELINRMLHSEE